MNGVPVDRGTEQRYEYPMIGIDESCPRVPLKVRSYIGNSLRIGGTSGVIDTEVIRCLISFMSSRLRAISLYSRLSASEPEVQTPERSPICPLDRPYLYPPLHYPRDLSSGLHKVPENHYWRSVVDLTNWMSGAVRLVHFEVPVRSEEGLFSVG